MRTYDIVHEGHGQVIRTVTERDDIRPMQKRGEMAVLTHIDGMSVAPPPFDAPLEAQTVETRPSDAEPGTQVGGFPLPPAYEVKVLHQGEPLRLTGDERAALPVLDPAAAHEEAVLGTVEHAENHQVEPAAPEHAEEHEADHPTA